MFCIHRNIYESICLHKGMSAGARVYEYTSMEPTIPLRGGSTIPYHSLFGDIEFCNIDFKYPTRPNQKVLSNFNLKIPAGQMVNATFTEIFIIRKIISR